MHGADGAALLRAVVTGYEVSTRIGVAVQPSHYRYWHTTGTVGTFGAAVAVASILRLDAGQTAHAIATAGTMAAALQQAFPVGCDEQAAARRPRGGSGCDGGDGGGRRASPGRWTC